VRFHSIEFINAFLRLFTSNNSIELQKISNHTEHLFSSPELLECCDLAVECAEDFNLTNLHNWLHLYPVQFGKKRFLNIRFCDQVHEGKRVDSIKQFIQLIVEVPFIFFIKKIINFSNSSLLPNHVHFR
jgi:hypothetical protein